jgi:DNA-binding NarL/FixJ family response regulator
MPDPGAKPPPGYDELTDREREVFAMVARGLTNAQIAARLVVSEATVTTHVARIFAELDLHDRAQAVHDR